MKKNHSIPKTSILILDDDSGYNDLVASFLRKQGYGITQKFEPAEALEIISKQTFHLVLVDYQLPGMNGLEFIERVKDQHPTLPLVLITHYQDLRVAVTSIKLGAYEFVSKPVQPDELLRIVHKAIGSSETPRTDAEKKEPLAKGDELIIGSNRRAKQVMEHISMVAPTKMNVLIRGESGTGKEHVAKTLHTMSRRADHPFVAVDCGAIANTVALSEFFGHVKGAFTGAHESRVGLVEQADKGTLFLDELGNLPQELQQHLLRFLQEGTFKPVGSSSLRSVDVRIVAATNDELISDSNDAGFRSDLFHRINEFEVTLPPLRERREDLDLFCETFVASACREMGKPALTLSEEVLSIFRHYSWPGNIRELKNMIRRAVLLTSGDRILPNVLPRELRQSDSASTTPSDGERKEKSAVDFKKEQREHERELIQKALAHHKYNKSKTADALGIDRSTLYKKIKEYNLDA